MDVYIKYVYVYIYIYKSNVFIYIYITHPHRDKNVHSWRHIQTCTLTLTENDRFHGGLNIERKENLILLNTH